MEVSQEVDQEPECLGPLGVRKGAVGQDLGVPADGGQDASLGRTEPAPVLEDRVHRHVDVVPWSGLPALSTDAVGPGRRVVEAERAQQPAHFAAGIRGEVIHREPDGQMMAEPGPGVGRCGEQQERGGDQQTAHGATIGEERRN
jgi:hypothetical protein